MPKDPKPPRSQARAKTQDPKPPKPNPRSKPIGSGRVKGRYTHYIVAQSLRNPDQLMFDTGGVVVSNLRVTQSPQDNRVYVTGTVAVELSEPGNVARSFEAEYVRDSDFLYVLRTNPPNPNNGEEGPRPA